jgi:hypothetical protein
MKKLNCLLVFLAFLLVLVSCHKGDDDFYPREPRPERPSDVKYFIGCDEYPRVITNQTGGKSLVYDSWIIVQDGNKRDSIGVTLVDSLVNINMEIEVSSFNIGNRYNEPTEYREVFYHIYEKHEHIIVTDSVIRYPVTYDNFHFYFEAFFQVPKYDNNRTVQEMNRQYFDKEIIDEGYKLTKLGVEIVGGSVFARKLYTHSIIVKRNGVQYKLVANIILKRMLNDNDGDCIIDSEFISSGYKEVKTNVNETAYISFIKVKQFFLSGKEEVNTFEVHARGAIVGRDLASKVVASNPEKQSEGFVGNGNTFDSKVDEFLVSRYIERVYAINYNHFTTEFDVIYQELYYDDGVNVMKMPSLIYGEIASNNTMQFIKSYTSNAGVVKEYKFTQFLRAKFDTQQHRDEIVFNVVIPQ